MIVFLCIQTLSAVPLISQTDTSDIFNDTTDLRRTFNEEILLEERETDEEDSDLLDVLDNLKRNPYDLNKVTLTQLESLPFMNSLIAKNIIDLIERGRMTHHEKMSDMAAACIASMGDSLCDGSAATIMIYPVVPDVRKFPNDQGRDLFVTHMEMGLAGAWMKRMIHTTFMHKLRARIGWKIIPE